MITKPSNYDEVEVKDFNFTPIELGGHKGVIKVAEEYTSPTSGKTSIKVYVDTDVNDKQPSYFQEQYKADTRTDRKWSNNAIKYVSLGQEEGQVRQLKGFITAVENSNKGFTYNWAKDLTQLKGKKIGLVFGMEEYQNQAGELKTITRVRDIRSYDKVDNVSMPKVRLLDGRTYVDYEEYINSKKLNKVEEVFGDMVNIEDNNFLD